MGDEVKFTQEELNAIADLQRRIGELTYKFGNLYLDKEAIELRMTQNAVDFDTAKKELDTIRTQERNLASTFQLKYGEGQLNPVTGVFTPIPKPPVA